MNDAPKWEWTTEECTRRADADKLVGHLSMRRLIRGSEREWDDPADLNVLRGYLMDLVKRCGDHKHLLPRTFGALQDAGGDLVVADRLPSLDERVAAERQMQAWVAVLPPEAASQ